MKRVEAVIRHHKLPAVLDALDKFGVSGVTVLDSTGFGRQRGHSEVFKGSEESFGLVPKRTLILYVTDKDVDEIIDLICRVARTGQVGDGKLVVTNVERAIRIRTGETANTAVERNPQLPQQNG